MKFGNSKSKGQRLLLWLTGTLLAAALCWNVPNRLPAPSDLSLKGRDAVRSASPGVPSPRHGSRPTDGKEGKLLAGQSVGEETDAHWEARLRFYKAKFFEAMQARRQPPPAPIRGQDVEEEAPQADFVLVGPENYRPWGEILEE